MRISDPAIAPCDFFDTSNACPLTFFNNAHIRAGFMQRRKCPGIEPGGSARQYFYREFAATLVLVVDASDFKFAARTRLELSRNVDDVVVVEVQTRYGEVRLGVSWLFFN